MAQLTSEQRVTECLKRVGPRGSQQWQSIPFEQLIEEIVVGGNLFGEGAVEGLQDIYGQEPHSTRIIRNTALSQISC